MKIMPNKGINNEISYLKKNQSKSISAEAESIRESRAVDISISDEGKEKLRKQTKMTLNDAKSIDIEDPIRVAHERYATLISVGDDGTEVWEINPGNERNFDDAVAEGIKKLGGRDNYNFWMRLSQNDPTFMGLTYSADEVRERLHNMGIQKGFFQVKFGNQSATHFLTEGKGAAGVYSKAYYDDQYYNYVKSGAICREYEPGAIFRIDGEEYAVTEDRKLDVPYGADIWNVEWPKVKN